MVVKYKNEAAKQRKTRKASSTFSKLSILTEGVEANISTLRSKFMDSVTDLRRNKILCEITGAVNSMGVASRTVQEVRDNWKNLTWTAKREFCHYGKEAQRTGDGPPP